MNSSIGEFSLNSTTILSVHRAIIFLRVEDLQAV